MQDPKDPNPYGCNIKGRHRVLIQSVSKSSICIMDWSALNAFSPMSTGGLFVADTMGTPYDYSVCGQPSPLAYDHVSYADPISHISNSASSQIVFSPPQLSLPSFSVPTTPLSVVDTPVATLADQRTNKRPPGAFRLSARSVFLTYPKSRLSPEHLTGEIERRFKFQNYYAVRELHKDGTPHYHVLGEWEKKQNVKKADYFDIFGEHPNIEQTRNRLAAWRYLHKPGGESEHIGGELQPPKQLDKSNKEAFFEMAICEDEREKFFQLFKDQNPRDLMMNWNNLKSYANDNFKLEEEEYETPKMEGVWVEPMSLLEWKRFNLKNKPARPKTLVLYGDTRLYKTMWARSLGSHCYMSGCWNATLLDQDKDYIVVDDIPLDDSDMFKHYKQILGCQTSFSVTDKYVRKLSFLKWGKPCIYISNQDPREYKGVDVRWLEGNCSFVEIKDPIFSKGHPLPPTEEEEEAEEQLRRAVAAVRPELIDLDAEAEDYHRRERAGEISPVHYDSDVDEMEEREHRLHERIYRKGVTSTMEDLYEEAMEDVVVENSQGTQDDEEPIRRSTRRRRR